ncbi:sigma-70 family RNA polymerase sigma factor [Aneurinibacillus sp. Ricciae_BoGa-3]|uniref:RNA polymerase sigma factor n=1 Tax=Aneurinibacillus sp. Ricciae_BoGa-3 TaxID=3022697 RepID=UPI00234203C9|nr:sigma-70 family RNA polymerase sigma factor [Aneurinibacillus sp. Ricciae_BoGa-3]WCK54226.1 sigma-70 family RNA polymerase sigma factor [Aneurinibacillus sp. Ricciae_BoGa-3]
MMDQEQWTEWFSEYEFLLNRWTSRFPKGPLQEEAMQIARIACWRRLPSYDPARGASLQTYLFRAVQGALHNWYRRYEARWLERHYLPAPVEGRELWENEVEDDALQPLDEDLVWQSYLEGLPQDEAQFLTLHYKNGFSLPEVARIMEIPYERLKKRKQRCLVKLRQKYGYKETI